MVQTIKNTDYLKENSNVVNILATTDKQLVPIFKKVSSDCEKKALALVQTKLEKNRQVNILKAVMVNPFYWQDLISHVDVSLYKQIYLYPVTSEFLLIDDRFIRLINNTLAPRQKRVEKVYEVKQVEGIGQIDLQYPFNKSSICIKDANPILTFPSVGLLQFDNADIGKILTVSFVTASIYNVLRILRTGNPTNAIGSEYAYVMHPLLANLLKVNVPLV